MHIKLWKEENKIGMGNTAEIFLLDKKRILKLFKTGYSKESVLREYNNHYMVSSIIDNVPDVYEFVEESDRFGYIMEYIPGKHLASMMFDEKRFDEGMELFVKSQKMWL